MPESRGAEDAGQPADAESMHEATERARAFAAEWLAQRARMETAVAEYEALKALQSPEATDAGRQGSES